jgi:protein MpaA
MQYLNKLKSTKTKLGNTIELIGDKSAKSLVIGVFHGDEPQGKFLIDEYLKTAPSKSKISVPLHEGDMTAISRSLRNNMTREEIKLWQHIKNRQILGIKFRRQAVIGNYICDFVSFEKKLIIEIDGGQHNYGEQKQKDILRDNFFVSQGFRVLRFWNTDISENISGVIEKIQQTLCTPLAGGPESLIPRRGILFIPCLNPDGMQLGTRCNSNGVDLNRNFPTRNWGEDTSLAGDNPSDYFGGKSAGSEIETQFVMDVIDEYKPERILTLHAPYKVVNYDGPARELAEKISKIIKYPVESSIGYPTPGSFGTYCGVERSIPTITLELDEKIPVEQLIQPVSEIFDMI